MLLCIASWSWNGRLTLSSRVLKEPRWWAQELKSCTLMLNMLKQQYAKYTLMLNMLNIDMPNKPQAQSMPNWCVELGWLPL